MEANMAPVISIPPALNSLFPELRNSGISDQTPVNNARKNYNYTD